MCEIIVSCPDENNILQLYHIKEDGSSRRKITNSNHECMMPAVSPDGSKIVFVQQSGKGMALWISNFDGRNQKVLTESGRNLIPSWFPDSKHIVWMIFKPGKHPAKNSQLHIMNTETRESRRLFSDPQQIKFSNSMAVISPEGTKVAFVLNRSGNYRVWLSNLDGSDAKPISPTSAWSIHLEAVMELLWKVLTTTSSSQDQHVPADFRKEFDVYPSTLYQRQSL